MSPVELVSIHSCSSICSSYGRISVSSFRHQHPSTVRGDFDKGQLSFLLHRPNDVEKIESPVSSAGKFGFNTALISSVTASSLILADGSSGDCLAGILYSAGQDANAVAQGQLSDLGFASLVVIFGAGLVTSLSPCTLSVLPLTLGYIGAFGSGKSQAEGLFPISTRLKQDSAMHFWCIRGIWIRKGPSRGYWEFNFICYGIGNDTSTARYSSLICWQGIWSDRTGATNCCLTFSCCDGIESTGGHMLNLFWLRVIRLELPSFFNNFDPRAAAANFPSSIQAYLAGLTFALAASPCSTPVLASILGYVASTKDPVIGGSLLLAYTTGYVAPLLLAASFAGALQSLLSFRKFSAWINPMSGALLLGGGMYTFLDRLFPPTMSM